MQIFKQSVSFSPTFLKENFSCEYISKICINIIVEKRRETGVISEISDITNRTVISKNVDTYYYA